MNDNRIKHQLIGALIGAGLGYLVGSVVTDLVCPEYEEVEPILGDDDVADDKLNRFETGRIQAQKRKPKKKGDVVGVINYNKITEKPSLHDLTKRYRETQADTTTLGDGDPTPDEVTVVDKPGNAPLIVSAEEFGEQPGYTTQTLHYYVHDDVTTSDDDMIINEVDNLIGPDALDLFGQESGDDDVVFVRNHRTKCDYEVIRYDDSYTRAVLGVTDRPTTKVKKIDDTESDD